MKKFKAISSSLFGDYDQIGSERYFVTITCFVASVFLMILSIVHLIMSLEVAPVFFAGGSSMAILVLYLLVRFGTCLFIPKLLLTVLGLVMLDLTWYSKYLSNGPVLFFILIFGALILWVWEGRSLTLLLLFYFFNIVVLFLIDNTAADSLFLYPEDSNRSLDIYLSFTLYSALLIFLLTVVKKDFIRQKEKAIRSDRLKSSFLSNMSHEIRTPMNAIVGFSELLGNAGNESEKQQYINIIKTSSNDLLRLINDIIELSKIEAGDLKLINSEFSIQDLFVELKESSALELSSREKSEIHLDYLLPDGDIMIWSDSLRIRQVLSNLLNNAIKFTSKGSITFSCKRKGKELIFSVSDTGTGIPEKDQKRIFDRFTIFNYQGMNTRGSGIGLSIVEKIISILKGKIWLESNYGEGSTFYFSIPLIAPVNTPVPSEKLQYNISSQTEAKSKSVLVVDDNENSYLLINTDFHGFI